MVIVLLLKMIYKNMISYYKMFHIKCFERYKGLSSREEDIRIYIIIVDKDREKQL